MRYTILWTYVIVFLLIACKNENLQKPEEKQIDNSFEAFLMHFKTAELPFTVPTQEWYDKYTEVVGVEFYDTFVVKKLFGKQPNSAYAFYARLKNNNFDPIIIVQEKKDGSYFWLFTLTKKNHSVLDSALIAFKRVSESELDEQTATIDKDWKIKAKRDLNIVIIPEDEVKLMKQGIKSEKKHFSYKWEVKPNGKIEKISGN